MFLDIALSVAARSKVRRAAEENEPIPETWASEDDGLPTTDVRAAMRGLTQGRVGG